MFECVDAVVRCVGSWRAAHAEASTRVNGGTAAQVWESGVRVRFFVAFIQLREYACTVVRCHQ